ncbi:MAG: hypothetical protein WD024_04650 [Bacillota bacterium]
MPDKEIIQAVLDAVGVTRNTKEKKENSRCGEEDECAAPEKVFYFIFCNCVTINNGACEDWEFCNSRCPD